MHRILIATITLLQTTTAFACSDGFTYGVNFADGVLFLSLSLLGLLLAVVLRVLRGAFQLRLPLAVAAASAILPTLEWLRWGTGDCGYGFVEAAQICAASILLFILYELVMFYRGKRGERPGGNA